MISVVCPYKDNVPKTNFYSEAFFAGQCIKQASNPIATDLSRSRAVSTVWLLGKGLNQTMNK